MYSSNPYSYSTMMIANPSQQPCTVHHYTNESKTHQHHHHHHQMKAPPPPPLVISSSPYYFTTPSSSSPASLQEAGFIETPTTIPAWPSSSSSSSSSSPDVSPPLSSLASPPLSSVHHLSDDVPARFADPFHDIQSYFTTSTTRAEFEYSSPPHFCMMETPRPMAHKSSKPMVDQPPQPQMTTNHRNLTQWTGQPRHQIAHKWTDEPHCAPEYRTYPAPPTLIQAPLGRPYACATCPRAFARKHDLQRHIRVHTGAKPYMCLSCKKPFARTDALKRHLRMEDHCRLSPEIQAMKCAGKRRYRNL